MKKHIENPLGLRFMVACLVAVLAGQAVAQTFTTLHSFTATPPLTHVNSDGANPNPVILSGNTLYGTADTGGSSGVGTVFKVNADGTGFTTLHNFVGSDGSLPVGELVLSGNVLYGETQGGTLFKVNTDGTEFAVLHIFTLPNDLHGESGLTLSSNTLYGTTWVGGDSANGTVFAVNTNGTGFRTLHSFTAGGYVSFPPIEYTNTDGVLPQGGLILSSNTLYGTAGGGGSGGSGTLFKVNTDGTGFTLLHTFTATSGSGINSDGAGPIGLVLLGNTLYGTASGGGSSGYDGTVFKVNTDGTGFTTLHSFTGGSDGAGPISLMLLGNTLYGTTDVGGTISSVGGTLFKVNTDGTDFEVLHTFGDTSGRGPRFSMLSGNTLYGATRAGGSGGSGTVFRISLPSVAPQLTTISSAASFILTWPTNATGYTLQSTTNLSSSAAWTTNSPSPVVIDGQNTVTNPISGTQQFFRLAQ